jgi:hypothetical protein
MSGSKALENVALLARETRITLGRAPRTLGSDWGNEVAESSWHFGEEQFLLRGAGDHFFYYRKGVGITVERGAGADLSEESLWLNGSVYAAVASINGLLPIHASAVAWDGKIFAFTGPPGAGKSTMTAALGRHGLPMACDDTLVLDLSDPDRVYCHPGHKRLKLTAEALALTGADAEEKVGMDIKKFYAKPIAGYVTNPMPLAELIFLEDGTEMAIRAIRGGERIARPC